MKDSVSGGGMGGYEISTQSRNEVNELVHLAAVDELRSATDALVLIRRRDARAWPVAEVLVERWQKGALRRLLDALEQRQREVFVPTTEADLNELFGDPGDVDRRNRRRQAA